MASDEQQKLLKLEDPSGPSIWEAAADKRDAPPADAWEYQMRKAARDAVFSNLAYVPYSPRMPVSRDDPAAWMWKRK